MNFIIRALSQWGKDDGDYDSPTRRDETPDEKRGQKEKKKRKKAQRKKEEKAQKTKKWEKKR